MISQPQEGFPFPPVGARAMAEIRAAVGPRGGGRQMEAARNGVEVGNRVEESEGDNELPGSGWNTRGSWGGGVAMAAGKYHSQARPPHCCGSAMALGVQNSTHIHAQHTGCV